MFKHFLVSASATFLLGAIVLAPPASAQAMKTASACGDEYKTQKAALKAAKETKKDFIAACRASPVGTATPIGGTAAPATAAPTSAPASRASSGSGLKTATACNDEYKADKAALKAAKEKKKDFVAACRALPPGTPTPVAGATSAPGSAQPAPTQTTNAPAPQSTAAPEPAPAPTPYRAPTSTPSATGTPNGANQFADEGSAKARCPSATVVWVNTKSGVYHYAGKRDYGHTKQGAYMCESDATAAGDRAAKNGQ